jgi:hypothetical protein
MADARRTPDLEAAFADLRSRLVEPDAPTLAASVVAASADGSADRGRRSSPGGAWLRVAAIVLVVMALFALTPAREAVARWLGLDGLVVEHVDELPLGLNDAPGSGTPKSLAEARQDVGFDILVPTDLAGPVNAHLGTPPGGVTLTWPDEEVTITQHPGALQLVRKQLPAGTTSLPVTVDGNDGWWFTGDAHAVIYQDANGNDLSPGRAVADTLAWVTDEGIVVRVEAERPLETVLALAESMQ